MELHATRHGERKRHRNYTAAKAEPHSQIYLPLLWQQRESNQRGTHSLHGLQYPYGASLTKPPVDSFGRRLLMYIYQNIFQSSLFNRVYIEAILLIYTNPIQGKKKFACRSYLQANLYLFQVYPTDARREIPLTPHICP